MSSVGVGEERYSATDVVAGMIAVASIVLSSISMGLGLILQLEARPLRFAPAAIVLALAAGRMSRRYERLALKACVFAMVAWVVGMTLAVVTEHPLV